MNRNRYTKALLAAIGTGGVATAVLLHPAVAHADETSYLNDLAAQGLANNPTIALPLGYQICSDTANNGASGIANEVAMGQAVGFNNQQISYIVYDALADLCPSQLPVINQLPVSAPSGPLQIA